MSGKLAAFVLDLLFPPKCAFCGGLLGDGEEGLCAQCQESLPWTAEDDPPKRCAGLSQCLSPLWYQDQVRQSFHRYKFSGRTVCAGTYGKLMAQCVLDRLEGEFDLLTWVPLSKKRLRSRGYDQSLLLAQAMAGELGTAVTPTVEKVRDTRAQSSLAEADQRQSNVKGVYSVPHPELAAGKRILLVDDIVTTGSTLSECAQILLDAGAVEVWAATFARAH